MSGTLADMFLALFRLLPTVITFSSTNGGGGVACVVEDHVNQWYRKGKAVRKIASSVPTEARSVILATAS